MAGINAMILSTHTHTKTKASGTSSRYIFLRLCEALKFTTPAGSGAPGAESDNHT
jgi:hypothetical protein